MIKALIFFLLAALPVAAQTATNTPTQTPTLTPTPTYTPGTPSSKAPRYLGAQSFYALGGVPTVTPGRYCPPEGTTAPCHGPVIDKAYWVLDGGSNVAQVVVTDSTQPSGALDYPQSVASNWWFLECTGRVVGSTTTTNVVALRSSVAVSLPGDIFAQNDGTGGLITVGQANVPAVDGADLVVLIEGIVPWDRVHARACVTAECRDRPLTMWVERYDAGSNEPLAFDLFGCAVFWAHTLP